MELRTEMQVSIKKNFLPFITQEQNPECIFEFVSVDEICDFGGDYLYRGPEYDVLQNHSGQLIRVFKDHKEDDRIYAWSQMNMNENKYHVKVFYLRENDKYFDNTNNSLFHSGWEQVILWKKRMILHASLIDTKFGGILFSGPSGMGKSTQAALWEQYENATQINGDRPVLYRKEKQWFGCGSPYAGSSECYVNKCIPLRAIILLEQGTENSLKSVSLAQAVKRIYANSTVYIWNEEFVKHIMNLIINLASTVPIYQLCCRPDRDAVEILKEELQKEVCI
ncbi:MAG: hypothetical protein MR526_02520 [Blautia sp.]|uniref:hypothetical protein n=1 Tax=Blautia sp. TaxID=1955243 RepID=UPI00258EACF8|nr:hypothetical protein [Blautia sp.]MCI7288325.1 hypothetical protein [Blautia sp.]